MTITEFLTARYDEEEADWRTVAERPVEMLLHGRPLAPMMLADIAAKRAIVAMHGVETVVYGEPVCTSCGTEADWGHDFEPTHWPCPTLLALAQPYAEHADFDPAWRV